MGIGHVWQSRLTVAVVAYEKERETCFKVPDGPIARWADCERQMGRVRVQHPKVKMKWLAWGI
jgi:hypothetical protein